MIPNLIKAGFEVLVETGAGAAAGYPDSFYVEKGAQVLPDRNDGGAAKDGLPMNPLARLIFIRISEGFLPRVPLAVQKTLFGLAAFIASLTGVEKRLARYYR